MSQLKFRENEHAVKPSSGFRLDPSRGKLMGVCSGISRYTGIDSTWVRLGFVVGAFLSFGTAAIIYLAIGLIAD